MKLKTLTLHNIASIPDASINFDAYPLESTDVFLISGKTGAGKSTILDAICLALYDQTPRFASAVKNELPEQTDIKTNDPRQILRRGTGEGFILLTFQGNNGLDYEAKWSINRANLNASGRLQRRVWSLKRIHDNIIKSGQNNNIPEITEEIKACIGLDFNQFCRTSMLAQGEFSKFLNSNDNDKSSILEQLMGAEIYSKIGQKIYDITSEKAAQVKEAEIKMKGIKLLKDDEILQKYGEVESLKKKFEELVNNLEKQNSKKNWLSNLSSFEKILEKAVNNKQIAEEESKKPDFLEKQKLVEDWNKTSEQRGWLKDIAENTAEIKSQEKQLENLKEEYLRFLRGIRFEEIAIAEIDKQLEELKKYFTAEKPRKETLLKKDSITIHLKKILANKNEITREEGNVSDFNKKLNEELQPSKEKASTRLKNIQNEIEKVTKSIENEEKELDIIDVNGLRTKKEQLTTEIHSINLLEEKLNNFLKDQNNLSLEKQRYEKLKQTFSEKQEKHTQLKAALDAAISKEENSRLIYESQKDTVDKFAKNLRSRLHVGDDCPVCRQKIQKAFLPEDELDNLILSYKKNWEDAKKKLDEIHLNYNQEEAELKALGIQIADLKSYIEKGEKDLMAGKDQISKNLISYGLSDVSEKEVETLKQRGKEKSETELKLQQEIESAEKRESELKTKREGLSKLQTQEKDAEKKLQRIKDEIVDCFNKIQNSKRAIQEKETSNAETEKELEGLITGKWNSDWKTDSDAFLEELSIAVEVYMDNEAREKELRDRREVFKKAYDDASTDKKTIEEKIMPQWKELPEPASGQKMDEIEQRGNELIADVSRVTNAIKKLYDGNKENQKNLETYLSKEPGFNMSDLESLSKIASNEIDKFKDEIKKIEDNLLVAKTSWRDAQTRLEEHKLNKPELKEDETYETIENLIKQLEVNRNSVLTEKGRIDQELRDNANKQKEFEKVKVEIELKTQERDKWKNLNDHLGDATGSKFRKIALSFVLESLIHSANHYMATLSDRYTLKIKPGSFVILVEDHYQDGEKRVSNTLSGGETFLVSLALALALSDIGNRIGTDILFIDEGFGTLSGEPLESAIETLRSLHSKTGRHVGIISHIEELQERIPVKILVKKEGNSSASQIEVVPNA